MMNLRADSFVSIIHDDSDVRQSLSDALQTAGLQVETFGSGEDFLAVHKPDRPGCVVTDLHLPQMPGLELVRMLSKSTPPRPVIILTRRATLEEAIEAFRAGAVDLFVHPSPVALILQRIQIALASNLPRRRHYLHWLDVRNRLERLTPPELEVVKLLTEGLLNKQIAGRLNVAVRTIELRRANIFRKMEVTSLGDLLRLVIFLEIYSQGTPYD